MSAVCMLLLLTLLLLYLFIDVFLRTIGTVVIALVTARIQINKTNKTINVFSVVVP